MKCCWGSEASPTRFDKSGVGDGLIPGQQREPHDPRRSDDGPIQGTLEGDLENARDWCRRAEHIFPWRDAVQNAAAQRMLQEGARSGAS